MDPASIEKIRQEKKALKEEKRRLKKQQNPSGPPSPPPPSPFKRTWRSTSARSISGRATITIMSYNILAQTLCQRWIHPTAGDMLKWKTRRRMIMEEIALYQPDLMCLQEVDNYEEFYKESLKKLGYETIFHKHETKRHGCLIGYQSKTWKPMTYRTIDYDTDTSSKPTQITGNIGQLLALAFRNENDDSNGMTYSSTLGVVVGNTHFYWRPPSSYERCRQGLIYRHHLMALQKELKSSHSGEWVPLMLGDFNTQPCDPFYSIVTGRALTDEHRFVLKATQRAFDDDDHDYEPQPSSKDDIDATISAASETTLEEDGLMDMDDLMRMIGPKEDEAMQSVYSLHKQLWDQQQEQEGIKTNCEEHNRYGVGEPDYTNAAHVFKGTLDYLFIPPHITIMDVLLLPPKDKIQPALPNEHFGSDHVSLVAKILLP